MNTFNLIIYILKFFIPAFFSVLFRAYGLGYRNKKRLIIGLGVFTAYVAVVPAILILKIGYGQFTHLSTVVMTIASMSVLIFSTDSVGKTIFLQLVQGGMTTTMSVILNLVRTVFHLSYPMLVLMLAVASPLVYLLALRYWAKPLRFIADNLHSDLKAMIALPIVTMVVVYLIPVYPAQSFANHPYYCTFMMLAVEGGFFLYIYTFYRNLLKISRLLKDEARGKLLESEILSYQESLSSAKQTRHDLRHHNALILDYLETGNVAGAMDYLRANDLALSESKLTEFSANPAANAVLRIYARQAQAEDIAFFAHADLPEKMSMTDPELGALLSNLLENAVEACRKVEPVRRQLSFSAQTDEDGLRLEVRNSVSGTVTFDDNFPESTKPGGGTGTKSMGHIVQKHGGMLRFKQESDMFLTQILLPLNQ